MHSGTDPPGETNLDPWLDDPFPDFLGHLKRPAAPERASRTLVERPQPSGGSFFGLRGAKVFDFRPHFCHSAPMEANAFGFRLRANAPEGQKRFPISRSKAATSAFGGSEEVFHA